MENKPLVSVVIPMYQREKEITRCLDSVLAQTLDGLEIIVVDDGSSDGGYQRAAEYSRRFSHIKLYHQTNRGIGAARNTGIAKAHGKYIVFLDADDYVPPDAYKKLYRYAQRKQADVVIGNMQQSLDGTDLLVPDWMNWLFRQYGSRNVAKEYRIPIQNPSVCNKMIRLSLIRRYKLRFPDTRLAEDLEFSIRLFQIAKRIYLRNVPVYVYMITDVPDASLSQTTSVDVIDAGLEVMRRISLSFDRKGLREEERMFIEGPVRWLWERFEQIPLMSEKHLEYEKFKKLIRNYAGNEVYLETIWQVFEVSPTDFLKYSYEEYRQALCRQTPEEIVLRKLQGTGLGFQFILRCIHVRLRYKVKMIKQKMARHKEGDKDENGFCHYTNL